MSQAGIYIHIPYCSTICPYCDFYKTANLSSQNHFLDALIKEMKLYSQQSFWSQQTYETIYFGGGTPSLIGADMLRQIINQLKALFAIKNLKEVTLEVNPLDCQAEFCEQLIDLGMTRVSLGIQSFDDQDLKILGRDHNSQQALQAYETLRQSGFENISVDMMICLPQQTDRQLKNTLNVMADLKPKHISMYTLGLDKGSIWGTMNRYHPERLSLLNEQDSLELLSIAVSELNNLGYERYEISNFSQGLSWRSLHNQRYWQGNVYLGLGPSAHSYNGQQRWYNEPNVERYYRQLMKYKLPVEYRETLTEQQKKLGKVLLSLRTSTGVEKIYLDQPLGVVQQLQKKCLAIGKEHRLVLTDEGMALYDEVMKNVVVSELWTIGLLKKNEIKRCQTTIEQNIADRAAYTSLEYYAVNSSIMKLSLILKRHLNSFQKMSIFLFN